MYERKIYKSVKSALWEGKVIILYGARQVGKTTLVKQLLAEEEKSSLYLAADIPSRGALFAEPEPAKIKQNIGNARLVVIDEAQTIENIGVVLKVFHDAYPEVQLLATGSSSFDLANKVREPLTGRALEFMLYPLSYEEVFGGDLLRASDEQEFRMRYGWYPGIPLSADAAEEALELLATNTLYKDIFALETIKKPKILHDLVLQLAYRVGSVVSTSSIAREIATSVTTIERYLDLLEKMFVIVRLYPYSRNLGNERKKGSKIYFTDVGIRNSVIKDHKPLSMRNDLGGLFENYWMMERIKYLDYARVPVNRYFWQDYRGHEIDLVEEREGRLMAFECKVSDDSRRPLRPFLAEYPKAEGHVVTMRDIQWYTSSKSEKLHTSNV